VRRPNHSKPVDVEFRGLLPYRVSAALSLIANAPRFEGFGQQIYVSYAALSPELRGDIELIFGPLGKHVVFRHLWAQSPEIDEFAAFIGWLSQLDSESVRSCIDSVLHMLALDTRRRSGKQLAVPPTEDEEALKAFLVQSESRWAEPARSDAAALDRIIHLIQDPIELVARLVFIFTRFWNGHYKEIYDACSPIVARSLRHHAGQSPSGPFDVVYSVVSGKQLTDEVRAKVYEVRHVVFVPHCDSGPYVSFVPLDDRGESILLIYNCRPSGGGERSRSSLIRDIFPPLRALADETRLEIVSLLGDGELYAQQIVDRLDLSQSSISRHLNLLVAGGVLTVRRESGMKFYRIDDAMLRQLAGHLYELGKEGGSK